MCAECAGVKPMLAKKESQNILEFRPPAVVLEPFPLWQVDIAELAGHNLEAKGREEVNRMLHAGWKLLHIYTLKYQEDGVWRERPMAILGRPRAGGE